ncbi:MAG: iron ABC transporter permease [Clostridiales bacterium]|jgi:iron complex transport system permease protein|nr:iron ABC transporter permease [Clostridiales bacterium]
MVKKKRLSKDILCLLSIIIFLLLSFLAALSMGAVRIPIKEAIRIIFMGEESNNRVILIGIRFPRVLIAAIIGAGLSVVGAVMQGIFKNPLVDSYTLGMSAGASLGAVISIVAGINIRMLGYSTTGIFAFIGAVTTLFFVYTLSKTKSRISINSLLLSGVTVSYFLASIISFLMMLNRNQIEHIIFWTMGSIASSTWDKLIVSSLFIIPGIIFLSLFSRELNIMLLGEESAHYLGINIERLKIMLLVICSVVVGAAVSTGGTIGFLGLIVPHIVRIIWGSDHKKLIPYSALLGSGILMLSDMAGRILIQPKEIPVGVMTSVLGGPFFIMLLRRQKQKGA